MDQLMEWILARETEILWENQFEDHLAHHKYQVGS
jgi:hypothetical protein